MNIIISIFQILKDLSPLPNQMLLNFINNPDENSQPQKIHSLMKTLEGLCVSHSIASDSLWPHGLQSTRLLCLWNSPGKNTGVGCHFLLQLEGLTFSKKLYSPQGKIISSLLSCKETLFEIDSNISFVTYVHDLPLAQPFIANLCQEHGYMLSRWRILGIFYNFPQSDSPAFMFPKSIPVC